jgi:thiol-disulfide isomerase/thioredoxin
VPNLASVLAVAGLVRFVVAAQEIPRNYGQPPTPAIVANVLLALKVGDLAAAEDLAAQYRRVKGDTPEALQALGWVARGELAAHEVDKAQETAAAIVKSVQVALAARPLDAEPYLPLALGTAYEVQAETLFAQGRRADALRLLQRARAKWRETSLDDRLQKNINLMTLQGRPMPWLQETEWLGKKPAPTEAWRGKVVLLFFWAHWCADCKAEAPIIAKLGAEMKARGLAIVAPTRRYGYTFDDDHAPTAKETAFIEKVFERYYEQIPVEGVPLNAGNFQRFGASTTPTLVLVDRGGIVRLYHPGVMREEELREAIEPLLHSGSG